MPFTTSHPAIVLPLKRLWPRWFSLSGLMAGAMSPDLLYFLLADTTLRGFSHSWPGLLWFCVPAGVVFTVVFHRLFKYEFIRHLPRPLERWLSGLAVSEFDSVSRRAWLVLISSVLIGALSHFFWDSFTHASGEVASRFEFFSTEMTVLGYTAPFYRILQHGSSLGGALAILLYLTIGGGLPARTALSNERSIPQKLSFWIGTGVTAAGIAVLSLWIWGSPGPEDYIPGSTRYMFVARIGLACFAAMFHYAVLRGLFMNSEKRDFEELEAGVSSPVSGNQPAGIPHDR